MKLRKNPSMRASWPQKDPDLNRGSIVFSDSSTPLLLTLSWVHLKTSAYSRLVARCVRTKQRGHLQYLMITHEHKDMKKCGVLMNSQIHYDWNIIYKWEEL